MSEEQNQLHGLDHDWADSESDSDDVDQPKPLDICDMEVSPDCSLRILASYMHDRRFIQPCSIESALNKMALVQHSMCRHLMDCNSSGLTLSPSIGSLYLKFRHDIFANICLQYLGISLPLGTDADLSTFGSDKTPDFMLEREDQIYLLEFTVTKRPETASMLKGGQLFSMKYEDECRLIRGLTGKPCRQINLAMYLDGDERADLANSMSQLGDETTHLHGHVLKLKNILNTGRSIISPFITTSFGSSYHPTANMQSVYDSYLPHLGGNGVAMRTYRLSEEFLRNFPDSVAALARFLSNNKRKMMGVMKTDHGCHSITFARQVKGHSSVSSYDVLAAYEQNDMTYFVKNMLIDDNGELKRLDEIKATIKYHIDIEPKQIVLRMRKPEVLSDAIYAREMPCYHSMYVSGVQPDGLDSGYSSYVENMLKYTESGGQWDKFERYDPELTIEMRDKKFLFSADYMEKLIEIDYAKLLKQDSKAGRFMLANNPVTEDSLEEAAVKMATVQNAMNDGGRYRLVRSFQIPLVTGTLEDGPLDTVNTALLREIADRCKYLQLIVDKILKGRFVKKYDDTEIIESSRRLASLSADFYILTKELNDGKAVGRRKLTLSLKTNPAIVNILKRMDEENARRKKLIMKKSSSVTTTRTVKLNAARGTDAGNRLAVEMAHYGKSSGYEGVGNRIISTYDEINVQVVELMSYLQAPAGEFCKKEVFYNLHGPGPEILTKLKKDMLKVPAELRDEFMASNLGRCCEFGSRLCYTLIKLSSNTLNSKHVTYDNLGYSNVVLFVKGGKKSSQTGKSRLFRVCHPYNPDWMLLLGYNETHDKFCMGGHHYVITPWMQMDLSIMKYGLTMYHTTFLDISTTLIRNDRHFSEIKRFEMVSTILSFHQKRQTEIALHSTRYLTVNACGDYTNMSGVISTFCSRNYSYYDAWIKESIKRNLSSFFKTTLKLNKVRSRNLEAALAEVGYRHLITGELIIRSYELVSAIYCTYTMTTGQYNKAIEQAGNLMSVIEDLEEGLSKHHNMREFTCESLQFDCLKADASIYEDDFAYCPQYCQYLGKVMGDSLRDKLGVFKLTEIWDKCINKPVQELSTPSGLRGYKKENFFNKKGYAVVQEFIYENFLSQGLETRLRDIDLESLKEKTNLFRSNLVTVGDCCLNWELVEAFFHVVDKLQRAGQREIYVMDIMTKFFQQPIEAYIGELCSYVEGEYISVPSDSRPAKIHSLYYSDKKVNWEHVTNLTLDCRRWAPRSVVQKYMHFIHGMSESLPESFTVHFFYFFDRMLRKKVATRAYVYDVLKNNRNKADKLSHLEEGRGKHEGAYIMEMPNSFVMGMFNYLSSLMHVANQEVITEVAYRRSYRLYKEIMLFKAIGHSDDSTAKLYFSNEDRTEEALAVYDANLKFANHMISVKKSVVSKVYQEMLSILYFFGELLSVTKKFIANIPFQPTDKGYSVDITFCASKCLELIQNGGTFQESYLMMKVSECCIRDFYNIPNLDIPAHYGSMGLFDPHPIELVLAGTGCEIVKHCMYNKRATELTLEYMHRVLKKDTISMVDPVAKWEMGYRIPAELKRKFENLSTGAENTLWYGQIKDSWTIANGHFDSILLSFVNFKEMMKDPTFYRSLVSDDPTRSLVRVYGAYKARTVCSEHVQMKPAAYYQGLAEYLRLSPEPNTDYVDRYMQFASSYNADIICFYDSLSGFVLDYRLTESKLTLKPIQMYLHTSQIGYKPEISIPKIVTYLKEPKLYYLYGDNKDPTRQIEPIKQYLDIVGLKLEEISKEDLAILLRKICGRDKVLRRAIAYVHSDRRHIRGASDMMELVSTHTFMGQTILFNTKSVSNLDNVHAEGFNRLPRSLVDYARLCFTQRIIESKNLLAYSKPNLEDDKRRLATHIDPSWLPLVESEERLQTLDRLSFWLYYPVRQQKVGKNWVGAGEVYCRTPDLDIQLELHGSTVVSMKALVRNSNISRVTNWYIENVLCSKFRLLDSLLPMSHRSLESRYLCYNQKQWSIDNFDSDTYIIEFSDEVDFGPPFRDMSLKLIKKSGKTYISDDGRLHAIETVLDAPRYDVSSIKEYLDLERIKRDLPNSEKLQAAVTDLRLEMTGRVRYNTADFIDRVVRSRTYDIVYKYLNLESSEKGRNCFVRALMCERRTNESFAFPDAKTLSKMLLDPMSAMIPDSVLDCLSELHEYEMSEEQKKVLNSTLNELLLSNNDSTFEWNIFKQNLKRGAEESLVLALTKNLSQYNIIVYAFGIKYPFASWLNDIYNMTSEYIQHALSGFKYSGWSIGKRKLGIMFRLSLEDAIPKYGPTYVHTHLFRLMGKLCDEGMLDYFNAGIWHNDFKSLDFVRLGKERFLNMLSILLHKSGTPSLAKTIFKKNNEVNEFYKPFISHQVNRPPEKIEVKINNRLVVIRSTKSDWPGNLQKRIIEDELEDAIDELQLDGDISDFEMEDIEERQLKLVVCRYLTSSIVMMKGGLSCNMIFRCNGYDHSVRGIAPSTLYISENREFGSCNFLLKFGKKKIRSIIGYAEIASPNLSFTEPRYPISETKFAGEEITEPEGWRLRDQLNEKALVELSKKDVSIEAKKRLIVADQLKEDPKHNIFKDAISAAYKKLNNEDLGAESAEAPKAKSIESLIQEVLEKRESMAELLGESIKGLTKNEKSYVPHISKKIYVGGGCILQDPKVLGELDCIVPGFAEMLISDEFSLSRAEANALKQLMGVIKMSQKTAHDSPRTRAMLYLMDFLLSNVKLVVHNNSSTYAQLSMFLTRYLPAVDEDYGIAQMPLPERELPPSLDFLGVED